MSLNLTFTIQNHLLIRSHILFNKLLHEQRSTINYFTLLFHTLMVNVKILHDVILHQKQF